MELDASNNSLKALPPSLTTLTRLQTLTLDTNHITTLPPGLLTGCSSLATLGVHANPITVQQLRETEGFAVYEERRRSRTSKQIEGRVMGPDGGRGFSEGADVEQWQHWQPGQQKGLGGS